MIAYKLYLRDEVKGDELIGVLPERRLNPERRTQGSVITWVATFLGVRGC